MYIQVNIFKVCTIAGLWWLIHIQYIPILNNKYDLYLNGILFLRKL